MEGKDVYTFVNQPDPVYAGLGHAFFIQRISDEKCIIFDSIFRSTYIVKLSDDIDTFTQALYKGTKRLFSKIQNEIASAKQLPASDPTRAVKLKHLEEKMTALFGFYNEGTIKTIDSTRLHLLSHSPPP